MQQQVRSGSQPVRLLHTTKDLGLLPSFHMLLRESLKDHFAAGTYGRSPFDCDLSRGCLPSTEPPRASVPWVTRHRSFVVGIFSQYLLLMQGTRGRTPADANASNNPCPSTRKQCGESPQADGKIPQLPNPWTSRHTREYIHAVMRRNSQPAIWATSASPS
jgi:hypothetical protein